MKQKDLKHLFKAASFKVVFSQDNEFIHAHVQPEYHHVKYDLYCFAVRFQSHKLDIF